MANTHNLYTAFNKEIKLNEDREASLITSRNSLKDKIKKYFKEEKADELQPKFAGQGSLEMNTTVNPIPEHDDDENKLLKYDLDYGVYFIENDGEDNKKSIETWHNWIFTAVENHTGKTPIKKNTCVRVVFSDGHNIDLPIYYQLEDDIELAHKSKGWLESNPKEFAEWFNAKAKEDQQIRRIVRYIKTWKNFREVNNSSLKFPSGFVLTILVVNNFSGDDRDDIAFKNTIKKIMATLNISFGCLRPTTPKNEDLFMDYSETRKNNFLNALSTLLDDLERAMNENNFKDASLLIRKHFGERFPLGKDENEEDKKNRLAAMIGTPLAAKPYAE